MAENEKKCSSCGGKGWTFVLPRGNPFAMRIETLSRAMVEVRCYACRGSGLQRDCYEHPC
jgi:DnaJ-class molecular chaperone